MLAVALFGLDLLSGFATGKWAGIEFWVLVPIAEYASTIRTIPPRETKKRETGAGRAAVNLKRRDFHLQRAAIPV
jgi:hypothetical protein